MKTKQTVTAILFLLLLAGGVVLLLTGWNSGGNVKNLLKSARAAEGVSTKVETLIDGAETAINEDLDRDHAFIETFGAIQLWMGRRVVQDVDPSSTVVKLSTGALTFVDLSARYVDTAPHAEARAAPSRMIQFSRKYRPVSADQREAPAPRWNISIR